MISSSPSVLCTGHVLYKGHWEKVEFLDILVVPKKIFRLFSRKPITLE